MERDVFETLNPITQAWSKPFERDPEMLIRHAYFVVTDNQESSFYRPEAVVRCGEYMAAMSEVLREGSPCD